MRKTILCLIGPSGSGKTYIGSLLKNEGYQEIVSLTTRQKRNGEKEGVDYYFVEPIVFFNVKMIEKNYYSGQWYGTSVKEILDKGKKGNLLYQVTTYSGYEALKAAFGKEMNVYSIYIQASQEKREERMSIRGDSLSNIQQRISVDTKKWAEERAKCDFVLNNNEDFTIEQILSQVRNFIQTK